MHCFFFFFFSVVSSYVHVNFILIYSFFPRYTSICFFIYILCEIERNLLIVLREKKTKNSEVSEVPLASRDSVCPRRLVGYLRRLRWASRSKLSKSRESYLLLVEAGSKSSE